MIGTLVVLAGLGLVVWQFARTGQFAKDQWVPGSKVVYLKNTDYVPRKADGEPPPATTGERVAAPAPPGFDCASAAAFRRPRTARCNSSMGWISLMSWST